MQEQRTEDEIEAKIAELRTGFNKLKTTCGLRAISQATIAEYARELQSLQAKLR